MSIRDLSDRLLKRLSRETTPGRFIPELDGLRFVAIGMVILFHLNGNLFAKANFYEHGASPDWLSRAALVGNHGVELVFVISGFILALPFAAHHLMKAPAVSHRAYYLRRLTRLEPPYFVTIFFLMFLSTLMYRTTALPLNGICRLASSICTTWFTAVPVRPWAWHGPSRSRCSSTCWCRF
jgi:peptidoglycan/LPS O-acetylase OafA/YrhL